MKSDFESWYLENANFFDQLHGHNTILFEHVKSIINVLACISNMNEEEIDSDLDEIFDTGYSYLYNYISELKVYLKNYFDDNFTRFLKFDIIMNYNFYINDLKEMLVDECKYYDNVREEFDFILNDIENILSTKKEFDDKTINDYNVRILSVIPEDHDYVTTPELFVEVMDKLKI